MAEFRLALKKDLPKLTVLWQECFGDAPDQIGAFWSALFDSIRVYAAMEKGAPVSMLCALPVSLVNEDGESFPAAYLYAVCTAKKFRGQGLCARLMTFAENSLKKEGVAFSCLVPSETSLFGFYEKLGYTTAFYHKTEPVSPKKGQCKITRISPEAYQNLRQMQLYGNFVDYSLPLLTWQKTISEASGGGLFRIETSTEVICAAAEKQGQALNIKELLPYSSEAAAALAAQQNCDCALVRSAGMEKPFGMVKALSEDVPPECAYLGLAFD